MIEGELSLVPPRVAPVCQAGERLELTCSTTEATFIRWSFSVVTESGSAQNIVRNINSNDLSQQTSTTTVDATFFNFTRTSNNGILPLVSTLTIDSPSSFLNETVIRCLEVDGSMAVKSTTIIFIDSGSSKLPCEFHLYACMWLCCLTINTIVLKFNTCVSYIYSMDNGH